MAFIEPMHRNKPNITILLTQILLKNQTFSFKKMHLKMSSEKCQPFCLGLNVLTKWHLRSVSELGHHGSRGAFQKHLWALKSKSS